MPPSTRTELRAGQWDTAIAAGGPSIVAAATVVNPDLYTNAAYRLVSRHQAGGDVLRLRLGRDPALTITTPPVLAVFGRKGRAIGTNGGWERLTSRAGSKSVTISAAADDTSDGTLLYTNADAAATFDARAYDEFLVLPEVALAGTGTTSTAVVEARLTEA